MPSPMPRPAPVTIAIFSFSKSPDSNATRLRRNAEVTARRQLRPRNRHRNEAPLGWTQDFHEAQYVRLRRRHWREPGGESDAEPGAGPSRDGHAGGGHERAAAHGAADGSPAHEA